MRIHRWYDFDEKEPRMSMYKFPASVSELIEKQLASGRYQSEDEVLEAALLRLDDDSDDWPAVKEAIEALDAGDNGVSLDDAFQEVRRRHSLSSEE
jgi:Arc/MetJ-type ribon-helix-helix transcriptional regulator